MPGPTVRITENGRSLLRKIAKQTGQSMQAVLDQALEQYRRKCFLEGLAADYAALKADPNAWADELAERTDWDATLMDGLDPEERPANSRTTPKGKRRQR